MNGVQHDYYYVDGVLMYEKVGTEYEMFYRYDTDGRLSMVTCRDMTTGQKYYYNVVTNAQGDVVNLLGGSGAVRVTYTYDAYGRLVSMTDSTAGAIAIGSKNSIRYRGYVYDSETEMYYLQSRYYDPETGRFINCDAPDYIGVSDTFTSWNGFAYCENDPVNGSDPSGNVNWRNLTWRNLSWKSTVGWGIVFVLIRLNLLKNDIKGLYSLTNNKIHAALATALVYSKYYISAEIISYICNVATAVAVLNTIINLITFAMTGPVGNSIKVAIKAVGGLVLSYLLPGLATSLKMVYYGLKYHRGSNLNIRWTGISVYF